MPKFIDPFALAEKNATINGRLPIKDLSRLSELLFNQYGDVAIELNFLKVDRLSRLRGQISADLVLKCQRCLEAIDFHVDAEVNLGIVNSIERADRLPDNVEPLIVVSEDKVSLIDLIEDELLLSVPDIPKHDHACVLVTDKLQQITIEKNSNTAAKNAFSMLAELIKPENSHGSTKK